MARVANRKKPDELMSYLFEIVDWTPHYSIALGRHFREVTPYWEHVSIDLSCAIVAPKKHRGLEISGRVFGDREKDLTFEDDQYSDASPKSVASLTIRGQYREFLASLPQTSIWGLVSMLQTGRTKYVRLHGEKLRYGNALAWSMGFDREYEPDDF